MYKIRRLYCIVKRGTNQSTSYFDVSLHGGIPPGRPPDLELVGDIFPFGLLGSYKYRIRNFELTFDSLVKYVHTLFFASWFPIF